MTDKEQEPATEDDGTDHDDQEAGKILPDPKKNEPQGIVRKWRRTA